MKQVALRLVAIGIIDPPFLSSSANLGLGDSRADLRPRLFANDAVWIPRFTGKRLTTVRKVDLAHVPALPILMARPEVPGSDEFVCNLTDQSLDRRAAHIFDDDLGGAAVRLHAHRI